MQDGKADLSECARTADYFDNCNFAPMIRCETWISTGFIDFVCPPTSVYCAFNRIPVQNKHIITHPAAGHDKAFLREGDARIEQLLRENESIK